MFRKAGRSDELRGRRIGCGAMINEAGGRGVSRRTQIEKNKFRHSRSWSAEQCVEGQVERLQRLADVHGQFRFTVTGKDHDPGGEWKARRQDDDGERETKGLEIRF